MNLPAPNLSDDMIKGYRVGLRPFRTGGLRIEREDKDGKIIVHNYGHGGAGISLSWGSARSAIELIKEEQKVEIAVIGAGVIGLTTAMLLSDLGFNVHIYAKKVSPYATSDIAGAHFSPFLVESGDDELKISRFKIIKEQSYDYLYKLATEKNPRFPGVSLAKSYSLKKEPQDGLKQVQFGSGKIMWLEVETTILINTTVYLQSLMDELEKRQVQIQQVNLVKQDLSLLKEKIIFNCTGLGAQKLNDDAELKPIRGYLIEFKAQKNIDYFAYADSDSSKYFTCMFSHNDKLLIGGSIEEDNYDDEIIDHQVCQKILDEARMSLSSLNAILRIQPFISPA